MRVHNDIRPMLVVVSEHFTPSHGATSQLVSDVVESIDHSKSRVVVITSTPGPPSDRYQIYRTSQLVSANTSSIFQKLRIGLSFFFSSFLWIFFHAASRDHILIVSNPPFIAVLGPIFHLLKRISYTFLYQDVFPRSAVHSGLLPGRGPMFSLWTNLIGQSIRFSKQTIVLSNEMRDRCLHEYGPGLPLVVIPNWAVEKGQDIEPQNNPLLIELGLQSKFVVQYSGNFGRMHDLLTVLEAALILKSQPIAFLFIGGGPKKDQIQAYKEKLDLNNISVIDYVPRTFLPVSLAACHLSIVSTLPSCHDIVAPSKLYGILASHRAVISISNPSSEISRLITYENIGMTVQHGDVIELAAALLHLSKNPQLVAQMSTNAYRLYNQRYGKEKSLSKYRSVLTSPSSPT